MTNTVNEQQVGDMRTLVYESVERSMKQSIERLYIKLHSKPISDEEMSIIFNKALKDFEETCEAGECDNLSSISAYAIQSVLDAMGIEYE